MPEQNGDKSQDPTPHRRQEAREQGEIARSQDLAAAVVLVAGLGLLFAWWNVLVEFLGGMTARQLGGEAWVRTDAATITAQLRGLLTDAARPMVPFFGLLVTIAVAANLMQFGLLFLPDKLVPDLNRINPLPAFARLFSLQNWVRLAFG